MNGSAPGCGETTPTTATTTPPSETAPGTPGQQAVLGVREQGTSAPATPPTKASGVLGENAAGTAPASGRAPASGTAPASATAPVTATRKASGSLPFTGTDAILVLLLGCALLLGGVALQRKLGRSNG
jgi:hypothetical protein